MNQLLESIPSTNVKIIELYNKIDAKTLIIDPTFQRKLVWKKQHKFHFIETVLYNYPFPEVYIASAEMDVTNITSSEVVVDGQQRLSTIVDYIKSVGDFKSQNKVKSFNELTVDEKKRFLNYFVSVRDLKNLSMDIIKDIFMRINNTEYSLNAIEKINAQYGDGEFIVFCKQLVDADYIPTEDVTDSLVEQEFREKVLTFFSDNNIFSENDVKRMIDLQFVMTLVATLIESDYFNRNQKVSDYIERYNASFDRQQAIEQALDKSLSVYNLLSFNKGSYWFTKSNTFTLLVEFSKINLEEYDSVKIKQKLEELDVKSKRYYAGIDLQSITPEESKYFDFGKEAVNEKAARQYRGDHVRKIIDCCKK
ncbi:DUF262 domain-containing protein [Kistimonas asteriae]|uniref:DUF262 domain-containing protein n=1 Tax=Kistimonas asteriae TaxID=517724 RepID=UPI001BA6E61C|nr:DUF262 domain-containing protein [Kistimonas asteriae]